MPGLEGAGFNLGLKKGDSILALKGRGFSPAVRLEQQRGGFSR